MNGARFPPQVPSGSSVCYKCFVSVRISIDLLFLRHSTSHTLGLCFSLPLLFRQLIIVVAGVTPQLELRIGAAAMAGGRADELKLDLNCRVRASEQVVVGSGRRA